MVWGADFWREVWWWLVSWESLGDPACFLSLVGMAVRGCWDIGCFVVQRNVGGWDRYLPWLGLSEAWIIPVSVEEVAIFCSVAKCLDKFFVYTPLISRFVVVFLGRRIQGLCWFIVKGNNSPIMGCRVVYLEILSFWSSYYIGETVAPLGVVVICFTLQNFVLNFECSFFIKSFVEPPFQCLIEYQTLK